jgi:integrase
MKRKDTTETSYPGIRRDGDGWLVRVALRDAHNRRTREKQKLVKGTIQDALLAHAVLRDEVKAEIAAAKTGEPAPAQKKGRPPQRETVTEYSKRWLVHLERTGRNRPHVIAHHVKVLEGFILPTFGKMDIHDVRRSDLADWMERLSELRWGKGKEYAKETLHSAWRTLRTLMHDALVLCDLEKDPTHGIRFTAKGGPRKEKDVLTQDELVRLLEQTEQESHDVAAMIWVGFTTGMRFGEISALLWEDVDFEQRVIHVRRSQVYGNVGPTKTNSKRSVPLHPVVATMLRAHKAWLQARTKSDVVFPASRSNGKGSGYRYSGLLTKPLARCAKRAGVKKHITAHTMRRTFNNLARQAAGEIVTRAMTGHMTPAMTEHYSQVTLAEKTKALENALGALPNTGALGLSRGVLGEGSRSEEAELGVDSRYVKSVSPRPDHVGMGCWDQGRWDSSEESQHAQVAHKKNPSNDEGL